MRKETCMALLIAMVVVGGIIAQESDCDRLFIKAVRENNIADVELHLGHSWGNLNAQDGAGKTGLMYAVEAGNVTLVEYLLNPPARANVRNQNNAVSDPNLEDRDGKTALIYAIEKGNLVILRDLLNNKSITIDYKPRRDNQLRTALHHAADTGWDEGVKLLLDRGANANVEDNRGITPFMLVLQKGRPSMIGLFKDNPDFDIMRAPRGSAPPLLYALQNSMSPGTIQAILDNFENAIDSRFNGNGPLEYLELYGTKYRADDYTRIKEMLEKAKDLHERRYQRR